MSLKAKLQKVYRLILCKRFSLVDVVEMAKAYSDDLRRKFLGAYHASKGILAALAVRCGEKSLLQQARWF